MLYCYAIIGTEKNKSGNEARNGSRITAEMQKPHPAATGQGERNQAPQLKRA